MALITLQERVELRGSQLGSAFDAPTVITRVDISRQGTFAPQSQTWADYWRPAYWLGNPQIDACLRRLGAAWQAYIKSSFEQSLIRDYCFQYFSLLNAVISSQGASSTSPLWQRALQSVLSFECFTINREPTGSDGTAAGTITLRNPCYLLAKLKSPDAPDDTRYHPLILAGGVGAGLFLHYRRYRLSGTVPLSLLVYPATDPARRGESFRLLTQVATALGFPGDPYVETREERLWKHVVDPILQAHGESSSDRGSIEFVDIGAGSGALLAGLSQAVVARNHSAGLSKRLRLWLVDVAAPASWSVFHTPPLSGYVEKLEVINMDYRTWLASPKTLPAAAGPRIGLASKVFDMASNFTIQRFPASSATRANGAELRGSRYLPKRCLAPGGEGADTLQMSPSRIVVPRGHSYPQVSLSEFFRGLCLTSQVGPSDPTGGVDPWLPVRSVEPKSLVATDGASVIARLLEQCDYLVIEDADLRPYDLLDHLRAFSLQEIAVRDMTEPMGLTGNYAYVLWPRANSAPHLAGKRIW